VRKRRRQAIGTAVLALAVIGILALAFVFGDKDGRQESQRAALGAPLTVELAFNAAEVTITPTLVRPVTDAEREAQGYRVFETFSEPDLEANRIWVAQYRVERVGEGEIDPFIVGASRWRVLTSSDGERIHSSVTLRPDEPCDGTVKFAEPSTTLCAYFLVPADETVTELVFTGVDRSTSSRRTIGPIERYVTWTIEQ